MSVELINSANVLIKDKIPVDSINKRKAKIAQNIAKSIKIDGFRKGKVPLSVVENRYSDKILQDARNEALNEKIAECLKEKNIEASSIVGNPMFNKYDLQDNGIDFELKLGIFPRVEIDDISKLIPGIKIDSINKKLIDERIEQIAKTNGNLVEVEKTLENGDIANINFEGFIDGEAFDGGKAEGYDLEIGSKSFIDGFEDKLIGMKKGESKDINLTFPKNYAKHLAGKDVTFKVKLNAVKKRESAPIDDELAKKILTQNESATITDLEDFVKKQLENEAKGKAINEAKPKLIDNLVSGVSFDLPQNIVEQEIDLAFKNSLQELKEDELKDLQNDKEKAKERRESKRDEAQKSVKLTFIIDYLAKKDKIEVSNNEIYQMLYYEAMMMGANPKEVVEYYEKNNMLPAVKMTILENKVLNQLLESAISKDS